MRYDTLPPRSHSPPLTTPPLSRLPHHPLTGVHPTVTPSTLFCYNPRKNPAVRTPSGRADPKPISPGDALMTPPAAPIRTPKSRARCLAAAALLLLPTTAAHPTHAGEAHWPADLRHTPTVVASQQKALSSEWPSSTTIGNFVTALPASTPKRLGANNKLSVHLRDFVQSHKGLADASRVAKSVGIPLDDGRVSVMVSKDQLANSAALSAALRSLGASVRAEGTSYLAVDAPVDQLEQLAALPGVRFVSPEWKVEPLESPGLEGPVDGVTESGAAALHAHGITGRGVKVGVLDLGFKRYGELLSGGQVPRPAAARAFGRMSSLESATEHGTACAEIIHAMAPDATLYVAAFDGTPTAAIEGANWLAQQGVDIISASWGGHRAPLNDTALLDKFVDALVAERHILWVNAAGNEADRHWRGLSVDANGNHLIDVNNGTDTPDVFVARFNGGPFHLTVTWDDWGPDPQNPSATQDIDAFLLGHDPDTGKLRVIASSEEEQSGHQEPVETIAGEEGAIPAGTHLILALRATHVTRAVMVHVIAEGDIDLLPVTPGGSISSPADARGALAVGAVDVTTHSLAPYSSQGPTDDGRVAPGISAPTNTLSVTYSHAHQERFPGTSSATPHVSGFAALVKQMRPTLTADSLRETLTRLARPMGPAVPNNQYGYGHINGDRVAALIPAPSDPGATPPGAMPPGTTPPVATSPVPAPPPIAPPAQTPAPAQSGGLTDALDEVIRQQQAQPK